MYAYGSCTGGMNCSGGLGLEATRQLSAGDSYVRQRRMQESQKEGNGKIHMGLCALGQSSLQLVYIRNASSLDASLMEPILTASTPFPLSILHHKTRPLSKAPELLGQINTPFESWMVDAAGSIPASIPLYRTSECEMRDIGFLCKG